MNCLLCGSAKIETLSSYDSYYYSKGVNKCTAIDNICQECGLIFQDIDISQNDLNAYYSMKVLHNIRDPDYKMLPRLSMLSDYIKPGGRVLEIGAGEGSFIAEALKLGYHCSGFDPQNKKLSGNLDNTDQRYDCIVMNHVIEHIKDPLAFLYDLKNNLHPGGFLMIEVPDVHYYPLNSSGICHEHLYHFSWKTLTHLLILAGYKIIYSGYEYLSRNAGITFVCQPVFNSKPYPIHSPLKQKLNDYVINKFSYSEGIRIRGDAFDSQSDIIRTLNLSSKSNIALWGANGIALQLLLQLSKIGLQPNIFLCDKNQALWGTRWNVDKLNYPITDPSSLLTGDIDHVFICAVDWAPQIQQDLGRMGFPSKKIHLFSFHSSK